MKYVLDGAVGATQDRTYTGPPGLSRWIAVKQGTTGDRTCIAVTGSGQQCLGLIKEADTVGDGVYGIVMEGETSGLSGAALAVDIDVIVDANGALIPSTAQGDFVLGRTRTSCAEAGDEVIVYVRPYTR